MNIHLTIWWLLVPLIVIYSGGLIAGMAVTLVADDIEWYTRLLVLIWPAWLLAMLLWYIALFLAGKD